MADESEARRAGWNAPRTSKEKNAVQRSVTKLLDLLAPERATQIAGERAALPHREHAGLGARVVKHRGHVAGGEHMRVVDRAQRRMQGDETLVVERQA